MNRTTYQSLLLLILLVIGLQQAGATERHSLASITLQVEAFLSDFPWESPYPPEFEIQQLDPRLNLTPCAAGLNIRFRQADKTRGQTSLEVACPGPVQWRIHLPVRITLYDNALVTRSAVLRGQPLDETQVKPRKTRVSNLHQGYFTSANQLRLMQAARNLKTGTILTPANLVPRTLVESGQRITIVLNIQGLTVKTTGLALQSASLGQLIKVRNLQSSRVVEAVVSGAAEVTVAL
jgi:flagella basal body P-ring formation protein FlgA